VIQLRIALKNEVPPDFELIETKQQTPSNNTLQPDEDNQIEDSNNTEHQSSIKKQSSERNNQNLKRPPKQQQQEQIPKSKEIKAKSMNSDKVREKGSMLVNSK
jgi:hypothetical protein